MTEYLNELLKKVVKSNDFCFINSITRGIEREALRVTSDANLSLSTHPLSLGSALTHSNITTDFSESLIELITNPSNSVDCTLSQLKDIHKHIVENINDEYLWPMSTPCFIPNPDDIPLARYGVSNIGKFKSLLREGLSNRYGKHMQIISGIHYNFSMNDSFWHDFAKMKNSDIHEKEFISESYMGMIRNFFRYGWLFPYLFGASPCAFYSHSKAFKNLECDKVNSNTAVFPNSTSLRVSDFGYDGSIHKKLNVSYNSLESYITSVQNAALTSDPEFSQIGIYDKSGERLQISDKMIQIESELWDIIRPKRIPKKSEIPIESLSKNGVEYVELRCIDTNPFVSIGIDREQICFMDLFLVWCLLQQSPLLNTDEMLNCRYNFNKVAVEGLKPNLVLSSHREERSFYEWAKEIFDELYLIAKLLDEANGCDSYVSSWRIQLDKINDSNKTVAAQVIRELKVRNGEMSKFGKDLFRAHHNELLSDDYQVFNNHYFREELERSLDAKKLIESSDIISFDEYLDDYLTKLRAEYLS